MSFVLIITNHLLNKIIQLLISCKKHPQTTSPFQEKDSWHYLDTSDFNYATHIQTKQLQHISLSCNSTLPLARNSFFNMYVELVHVSFSGHDENMSYWTSENRTTVYKSHPNILAILLDETFPEYPFIM